LARYDNKEVAFEVPQGWEDKSVITFEAPRAPGRPFSPNVTLMRVPLAVPHGQPLATFATQQVASLAQSLPGFELVEQRNDVRVGGVPAVQIVYHWKHPDGALTQRVTMFLRDATLWSFAATAVRGDLEQTAPLFDRILASFQIAPVTGAPRRA
jgi:hypothetical protein